MIKKYLIAALLVACTAGCDTTEKEAGNLLRKAENNYSAGNLLTAKQQIDSVRTLYPKAYRVLRNGLQLMRRIEIAEQERTIAFCDSLLPVRQAVADSLKSDFTLEKDTAYNETGTYVYKTHTVERNVQRCYVRSSVSEKGEMLLASVYYGPKPLEHTFLRLSTPDGTYVETPAIPYDGGNNYRFENLGMITEVVTYRADQAKNAVQFICANPEERIKAEYKGGKPYIIYLSDPDKKAICATYQLAAALNDIENMQQEIVKSRKKLEYLQKKLATPEKE